MSNYGQINFIQKVGNSGLGINEAGCFVTADCKLLEKVGVNVLPPDLNTFYTQKKLYTYDLTDKANDDITWSTVTKYCPQLVVNQIGGAGFPGSDLAQVEFRYKDHTGHEVTHFCAVNSAADHSIIDSWDGKVRTPAEYEHVYGQPIAWATFIFHTPQTTPAGVHSAPVSAPAAVVPPSQPAPQPAPSSPTKLYLPPSVWIWHIYPEGGPYTLPYALKQTLNPKMFGGLTYDIIGNPAPHVYLIQTQNFGKVAIYAGPDTVAQFPGTGHGEGESISVPVSEVVPAPVTAPSPDVAPSTVYARFDTPMQLVTKEGAKSYNFESGMAVQNFQPDTPFVAVGKATVTLPDGTVQIYFMNDNDFGIADQTQRTQITVGIKTVDLSPAPKPTEGTDPGTIQSSATPSSVPVTTTSTASDSPAAAEANQPKAINSTVSWQHTFEPIVKGDSKDSPSAVDYVVKEDMFVYDLASGNDELKVKKKTPIPVVGTFIFAGRRYYLAQSSFVKGTWYGFPVAFLRRQNAKDAPFDNGDDINQLGHEIESITKPKKAILKAGGMADGFLARFKKQRSM